MKKRNRKTENTVQSSNALHGVFSIFSSLQGLGEMTVPTLSGFAEMLMRMGAALVLPTFIGQHGCVRQRSIWYGIICGLEKSSGR